MSGTEDVPQYSEPAYTKSDQRSKYAWYLDNIDKYLEPETQKLFEKYSKIPVDQQSKHVHEIRDRAWAIRAYPCTGLGVWLIPLISRSPAYADILKRVKSGGILMDVGCFLGHDLRRVAFDGAPSENLYGVDVVNHWDLGFDAFRDRDRFFAHFIEEDILLLDPVKWNLEGRVDVISISHVLHQWSWKDQLGAAKKLCKFSKPGTMVVGCQIGNITAKVVAFDRDDIWRQTPASLAQFWDLVGKETGTEWKTEAWLREWEEMGWDPNDQGFLEEGNKVIEFVVTRLR